MKNIETINFSPDTCTPKTVGVVLIPSFESNSTSFKFADIPTLNSHCRNPTADINITNDDILSETVNAPNIPYVKIPALRIYSIPN